MKLKTLTQTYNSGMLKVYSVGNIAEPGNMPKDGLITRYESIPYEERTVGITRNNLAKQDHSSIEQLVRIPRVGNINVHDVVTLTDGEQYDIYQIQFINDVEPKSMDLSLTRLEVDYDVTGT